MDAQETLLRFFRRSLTSRRRDRVCEFVSKPKTHGKFLDLLYHTLGSYFADRVRVAKLPDAAWASPAFAFVAPRTFGEPMASMEAAYDLYGADEGALLVTTDARFGVWCDHSYMDAAVFVAIPK